MTEVFGVQSSSPWGLGSPCRAPGGQAAITPSQAADTSCPASVGPVLTPVLTCATPGQPQLVLGDEKSQTILCRRKKRGEEPPPPRRC